MPVMQRPRRIPGRRFSRGLSLVELMVGVVVGLFVVAAGALLASSQLADNRSLLTETQLQQDLRATADIITRDLRRTSYFGDGSSFVPSPLITDPAAVPPQWSTQYFPAYQARLFTPTESSTQITYGYARQSGTSQFGMRLENGVIKSCMAESNDNPNCDGPVWQDLTDSNTMEITQFAITTKQLGNRARPNNDVPVTLPCPNVCDPAAANPTACWPSVKLDEFVIWLTGRSRADPRVVRTLKTTVRIRAPRVVIPQLAPSSLSGSACPTLP